MSNESMRLDQLPTGSFGEVINITAEGQSRRRLLDLGLIHGTKVESLRKSPAGDPTAYEIRGAVIALRADEASKVFVKKI